MIYMYAHATLYANVIIYANVTVYANVIMKPVLRCTYYVLIKVKSKLSICLVHCPTFVDLVME